MSDPPSSSSSSTSSSSICLHSKLQFFARVRRFLRSRTSHKGKSKPITNLIEDVKELAAPERVEEIDDLQRSVKKLHFGSWEEKETAAVNLGRLASQEDVKTRKSIAGLGVIPVLVEMVGSGVFSRRRAAITALIELANGTYTNKALMLEAGILSKFPTTTTAAAAAVSDSESPLVNEFSELILSLSSLTNPQFQISLSEILPFLITTLESPATTTAAAKESCLAALFNLSATLETAALLASNGVVSTLLSLITSKPLAEKALATLGQIVVTASGKRAMEDSSAAVPDALIEVLTWEDEPKCQELSAYVLMILAYQSSAQREKMARCGIVPALLEVALLGTPLAQKRALKLLQWFKDEREMKMGPHSGPQTAGRMAIGSPINPREAQEGRRLIKDLVKQSLNKNMEMITRRANAAAAGGGGCGSSKLKNLVISTSSKSLPY